ncbi:hypothetical protein [Alkalisalibacterium limincola]|uniref:Integron Cassette Protein Hfx-Cass5 domain-containing protein n=1 Tax=Alkalisalibacterium limincola TaxID=2699169 RepID=A0A5C8KG37_9GAMM|nr:hypothetical protein [Alkalisalibacterium limincola]TXK59070.1 hypothetical protein FU658_14085 [Alkalisalibacterium limincola]
MIEVGITRIAIDDQQRLCVFPAEANPSLYTFVYRAGAEITWDTGGYFCSPPPREWSYTRWLEQLISAVRGELGLELTLLPNTEFVSVPPADIDSMRALMARAT